ncbi:hypothetical protein PC116_g29822 [Phytophthora cactorum]|nr:hypothetical protein PC116_g29822 [Phytophthora cactorum]
MTTQELLVAKSQPALPLDGELSPLASPSYTPLSMPERGESLRKSRRRGGSRMLSVLRSLTNSGKAFSFPDRNTPYSDNTDITYSFWELCQRACNMAGTFAH